MAISPYRSNHVPSVDDFNPPILKRRERANYPIGAIVLVRPEQIKRVDPDLDLDRWHCIAPEANGQIVSRTTYPALWAIAQNNPLYGKGDGSTTFSLPNLVSPIKGTYYVIVAKVWSP